MEPGCPAATCRSAGSRGTSARPASNISALEKYLARFGITTSRYADGLDVTATGTAGAVQQRAVRAAARVPVPAVPASNGHGRAGRAMTIHGTTDAGAAARQPGQVRAVDPGPDQLPDLRPATPCTPRRWRGRARPAAVQTGSLTPGGLRQPVQPEPAVQARRHRARARRSASSRWPASTRPTPSSSGATSWASAPRPTGSRWTTSTAGPARSATPRARARPPWTSSSPAPWPRTPNIVVYQAPNTDFGFVDGFFTAASQNIADTVSASWGESETEIQAAVASGEDRVAAYAISFDEAFLELAAQGQSAFVSAGDFGAYTAIEDLGTTNLSAGNPDSSPWITTAGGTTLPGTIPLTCDRLGHHPGRSGPGAGTGCGRTSPTSARRRRQRSRSPSRSAAAAASASSSRPRCTSRSCRARTSSARPST